MADFWEKYQSELNDGYFEEVEGKEVLKPEFIVEYAKKIADELKDFSKNKVSQIWKYYEHTLKVQDRLKRSKEDLRQGGYTELRKLQPAVFYAQKKNVVTQQFQKFIDYNVEHIKNNDDLYAFVEHFQAVMAYLPRENQK